MPWSPALPEFLLAHQERVSRELDRLAPAEHDPPEVVHRAMRYTLLAPSKRVRAALAITSAELFGAGERAVAAAAAIEMVHASSLILDDLPSMDDAPLRRGRPANHVQFGEATAILAAFGLLTLAFGTITRSYEPALSATLAALVADAVGSNGLIAGQTEDLLATERAVSFERLERIHRLKTGALFIAAAVAGAVTAGAPRESLGGLEAYAKNLGLAFQIVDDLLDVEGDPAATGKLQRRDLKKTTFVSFSGTTGARELAGELCETATRALAPFGPRADRLRDLASFVAGRTA